VKLYHYISVVVLSMSVVDRFIFSARQHICYSELYAIARPFVTRVEWWISQKCLKLGSCNFHHQVAP